MSINEDHSPQRTPECERLHRELEMLREELEAERAENAALRRVLFTKYERGPRPLGRLMLPLPERAIVLFEVLPDRFVLDEALAVADRLGIQEHEAAEHLQTYFKEGMLEQGEDKQFAKTGYRPYY